MLDFMSSLGAGSLAKRGLKIIIVGCGSVGKALAEQLSKEGHDLTLIDQDAEVLSSLTNLFDVMGVVGNGASYSVQIEAGINDTDLIIAVTNSDELNLLCCTVAKQVADCAAIARVRTPDYNEESNYLREKLGLAMVLNPEYEAARESARVLYLPTALEINSFAHGQVEMIKFKVPDYSVLDGKPIHMISSELDSCKILICGIERNGDVYIPSGNSMVHSGDIISFVATRRNAKAFLDNIGVNTKQVKNTMIVGGGKASYYLAQQLLHMGINVKIIERNKKRCEDLSVMLPNAIIINGDGTDTELLMEEGIEFAESFVPLTGTDTENVMLTLYAKQVSNAKVITKINRSTFKNVINKLELGSVVYPEQLTCEAILKYVRAKKDSYNSNIQTLYHMFDARVEAIEFLVEKESKVTNIPLMELSLKTNLLISFINRNGRIIIPSGQDSIQIGDTVMIVTTHTGFDELDDILD